MFYIAIAIALVIIIAMMILLCLFVLKHAAIERRDILDRLMVRDFNEYRNKKIDDYHMSLPVDTKDSDDEEQDKNEEQVSNLVGGELIL